MKFSVPIPDNKSTKQQLLDHLLQFVTIQRKKLFDEVLNFRTRHITIVLEDIYQSQNASAVLRTCDLTGIQDIHIIENTYDYALNPDVALGSSKWVNMYKYNEKQNNTAETFQKLKDNGYRIVATTPHKNDQDLESIPLEGKLAVVLGTELTGLSETAIDHADEYLRIPMHGFTESYNISVSAALILFTLTQRLHTSNIDWRMTPDEISDIKLEWVLRTIDRPEVFVRHFLKGHKT